MNQTQQLPVTHMDILYAICKHLLTLATEDLKIMLSNRIIPILPPPMDPGIEQVIASIILAPQTLLMPAMKEVVTDTATGGAWINRNPR